MSGGADVATPSRLRWEEHAGCFVCGGENPDGLQLAFVVQEDRSVAATLHCAPSLRSYEGVLHGGVISAVLDAAMTNALRASGITGVTAELTVRFRAPTRIGRPAVARGWVVEDCGFGLHVLAATLEQDGAVVARAKAKFMERP